MTLNEISGNSANPYYYDPAFNPLYIPYYGFYNTNAAHVLDTGVGTTKLSPRTVYISPADFSKTDTNTLYFDLAKSAVARQQYQGAVLLRRPGEQALRLVRLPGLVRQLGVGRSRHLRLRQRRSWTGRSRPSRSSAPRTATSRAVGARATTAA
jgi:hypothetical protein